MHVDTDANGAYDQTYYYLQDDHYNVIGLVDETGTLVEKYSYDDYGFPTIRDASDNLLSTSAIGNIFMFTGRRWDAELQLYDYRTRYYDPAQGRFLRKDTIGLWGDQNNLGNPYAYVGNNPWTHVDPYGEFLGTVAFFGLEGVDIFSPLREEISRLHYDWIDTPLRRIDPNPTGATVAIQQDIFFVDRTREIDLVDNTNNFFYTTTQLILFWGPGKFFRADDTVRSVGRGITESKALRQTLNEQRGMALNPFKKGGIRQPQQLEFDFVRKKIVNQNIDYRQAFFDANPELKGKVVVHHAIEQQVITRYPGRFTEEELHSLSNLRGIPKELNSDVHLSQIRRAWDRFYRDHPSATRDEIQQQSRRIDEIFGNKFTPPIE